MITKRSISYFHGRKFLQKHAAASALLIFVIGAQLACFRPRDPQVALDHARQSFKRGDIAVATDEAERGYQDFHKAGPQWAWQYTILKAKIFNWQGLNDRVIEVLTKEPDPPVSGDLAVQRHRVGAVAYASLRNFAEAERELVAAEGLCANAAYPSCQDITNTRGMLEMRRGHYSYAQQFFERGLVSVRAMGDKFLEANTLLNLSWSADQQTHFDEALDWADLAREIALSEGFADITQTLVGNMGWAYYKLGDQEKAEGMFSEAKNQAAKLHDTISQAGWLTTLGHVYLDANDFKAAEQSFRESLELAEQIKSPEDIMNAQVGLALVYEQTGRLDEAKTQADSALAKAQAGDEQAYPILVQGRIAVRQHDVTAAEAAFQRVAQTKDIPVFLKWEAQRSLAHLYEDENRTNDAEHGYRDALSTFEFARCSLHESVDQRLPYLSNASRIYEDYIHFLIAHGKTNDALRAAESTRARTLSEGLGRPCKPTFEPELLDPQQIARHGGGTILFYALGEKQSYLWVITPTRINLVLLSATRPDIDSAVLRYRRKIEGPRDTLEASSDGHDLYQMLVAPAQELLTKDGLEKSGKIFIVPDGSLNRLNFETLVPSSTPVPNPKHYWIEDVTITNAGSLRMIPGVPVEKWSHSDRLLLIGNPISPDPGPNDPYPELPNSAAEIESVGKHFESSQGTIFAREQATPSGYLTGKPEQFSYIHFVAHGTASSTNPLDSAIILSRHTADPSMKHDDSWKLYARDIIQHPLHAKLVTVSACYSLGRRAYSGEGLVGLSWAFLRAGAHNVVGALWDVSDTSIPQLMDEFYSGLQNGKGPDVALRDAKLKLLYSDKRAYHSPFYWAPFQLYTGSQN